MTTHHNPHDIAKDITHDITVAGKTIGEHAPCFIIAEAGVNHDRDMTKAKLLIDIAHDAGVDAVKFQTWITEDILLRDAPKADYQAELTGASESQFDMVKKLELTWEEFRELKAYCEKKGILFLSTPDEERSAKFLVGLGMPMIKIGSGELNNLRYLKYLAQLGKPLILSTGMGTMNEVQRAVAVIHEHNKQLVVLQCTTDYPTRFEDTNILAMQTMKKQLGTLVGYSDHTEGIEAPIIAAALGAVVIEKHFTYDRNAPGPDHLASLSPKELRAMVHGIRTLEKLSTAERLAFAKTQPHYTTMLGSGIKKPCAREERNIPVVRKCIIATMPIEAGQRITNDMLIMKRSDGKGIPADQYARVIGRRANTAIPQNTPIFEHQLS